MSEVLNDKEKLEHLLQRRDKYFLLEGVMRKIYQIDFEKMQKEIIRLKLRLEMYHDELDLLEVEFTYAEDCKDKYLAIEEAWEKREIEWLLKKYIPADGYRAKYVGLVIKEPSNSWLRGIYETHLINRQGMIDCPWPMKLKGMKTREGK